MFINRGTGIGEGSAGVAFYHAVHQGVKKLKLISVALHCKHITTVAASTIIILFLFQRAVMNVSSFANTNVT